MITNERLKKTYLAHFGILGQKWGVRRYQNEDGSLTEEGRARYLHDSEVDGKDGKKFKELTAKGIDDFFDKRGNMTKEAKAELKRDPNSELSKAIKDTDLFVRSQSGWVDRYNEANITFNKELERINDKYKDADTNFEKPNKETLEYIKEISETWKKAYGDIAVRDFGEHSYLGREYLKALPMYMQYDDFYDELKEKMEFQEYKRNKSQGGAQ